MAYAILRTAKLKTPANVAASASHIERTRPTHNADLSISNEWLTPDGPGMFKRAQEVWGKIPKKRKDAVHAFEVLMTASPEAFDDDFDLEAWKLQSMQWAEEQFKGGVIVGACLHLDESTPHIQMIVIPTDTKKDGSLQLNCKKYLGGAQKLSAMQTSYAKSVASFGLERGLKGSKAKHVTIRQFYESINSGAQVKFKPFRVAIPPVMLRGPAREAWAATQTALLKKDLAKPISQLRGEAARSKDLEKRNRDLKRSNSSISTDLSELKRREKEAAAKLRSLPLEGVAQSLGCYQVERDRWESPAGKLSITGSKFFNHETEQGGGGAFDLVMHVHDCDYKTALIWLRDEYDPSAAVAAAVESARIKAEAEVDSTPKRPFQAPQNVETRWPRVREYLTSVRGLAGALVDKLKESGWLGADARANAFFIKMSGSKAVAAELRGTGRSDFKGSALGSSSKEGVFVVNGGKQRLAVCESAIDAISYVQLHPDATAISTGGTGKWRAALPFIDRYGKNYAERVCASDQGVGGEGMALNLDLPHDAPPKGFKDWNEALQAFNADPHALDATPEQVAEPLKKERKAHPRNDIDSPSLG